MKYILVILLISSVFCSCTEKQSKDTTVQVVSKHPRVYRPDLPRPGYVSSRTIALKIREYEKENKLPDSYGGVLSREDEFDMPTFYIVGDTVKGRKELVDLLGFAEFSVKSAKYSYNHLKKTYDLLSKQIRGEKRYYMKKTYKVSGYSFSPADNCIFPL